MPWTPLTFCSIGKATVSMTVLALAPGKRVCTCTVGGVTLGYCATGNRASATAPIRMITSARTLERTGRSMKKRENMEAISGWTAASRRCRRDHCAAETVIVFFSGSTLLPGTAR
jgi:hypothetical protein